MPYTSHITTVKPLSELEIPDGWIIPRNKNLFMPGDDALYHPFVSTEELEYATHESWSSYQQPAAATYYRLFTSEEAWSRAYHEWYMTRYVLGSGHYAVIWAGNVNGFYGGLEKVHCILLPKAEYDVWNAMPSGLAGDILTGEAAKRRRSKYDHT